MEDYVNINWLHDTGLFVFVVLVFIFPAVWGVKKLILAIPNLGYRVTSNILNVAAVLGVVAVLFLIWEYWLHLLFAFGMFAPAVVAIALFVLFILSTSVRVFYSFVTPRRTGLWLRKFHVEAEDRLRLSRVFERLSIDRVRMFTLADSKVATTAGANIPNANSR